MIFLSVLWPNYVYIESVLISFWVGGGNKKHHTCRHLTKCTHNSSRQIWLEAPTGIVSCPQLPRKLPQNFPPAPKFLVNESED